MEQQPEPLPWTYPYQVERKKRLGKEVLRPIVDVSLVGTIAGPPVLALVDSGCEHILAAPWVARAIGVNPKTSLERLPLGIGGDTVEVRFVTVKICLHRPRGAEDEFREWQASVGFVKRWKPPWPILMGQTGFLDGFTVTMHRGFRQTVVEEGAAFRRRYPDA